MSDDAERAPGLSFQVQSRPMLGAGAILVEPLTVRCTELS